MPTIMDVAREAAVGIGTVSRVINGSALVSAATRQRVLAAIERLGYQPSPIARAFGRRRTDKLEVLVPLFAQSFVLEILRGIEDALAETDCALVVRIVEDADAREQVFQECCMRGRADGALLVFVAPTESFVQRLIAEGFPAVLVNSVHPGLWSAGVDHDAAARAAVAHCIELGHRRIALVDRLEDPFNSTSGRVCQRGYQQMLADAGLELWPGYDRLADLSARGGATAYDALLQLTDPPTAIVAGSEAQAIGLLYAARGRGKRVPEDVSIVGYNDSELARDLGLTTMRLPLRELGRQATEMFLAAVAEPSADPIARYLPTELLVRQTCAAAPGTVG
jgi:DNA-binding LacI/PurR family transcriptional regulator